MAHTVDSRSNTAANQLRESLDRAERLIVQISRHNVEEFLTLLDHIEQELERLSADGIDLRPEETRWQSILNRLDSRPNPVAKAAAAAGGMETLRRRNPPAESFWWQLDRIVADRRRRAITRALLTVGGLIVAAAVLYWGINALFPPNPQAVAMVEATNQIDRLVAEQRWDEALAAVQTARQQLPDQPELAAWEVVIYERLGDAEGAAAALAEVQTLLADDPAQVWVLLGNDRLMAGDLDGAEAAAQEAAAIAPDDPVVTFLQGSVAEARGDVASAVIYFQMTSELAGDDNPQLNVIARVRLGYLMQSPNAFGSPVETPTPTPTP